MQSAMLQKPSTKVATRNIELYQARVKACLSEAKETPLPNVRERALRAAAVWQDMLDRAQSAEQRP